MKKLSEEDLNTIKRYNEKLYDLYLIIVVQLSRQKSKLFIMN